MKRVVVTGIGLLTSLGINSEISWSNLINRKSGIKKIKNFDLSNLPCKIAGYISHDQDDENFYDRSIHLENKEIKRNDRFIQYGLAAATMAVQDSGIENLNEVESPEENDLIDKLRKIMKQWKKEDKENEWYNKIENALKELHISLQE